jgi:hypothetical protein
MCLIIVKNKQGVALDYGVIKEAFKDNPHGWGVMWYVPGTAYVNTMKGFQYDELLKIVKKLESEDRLMAIHFRFATAGLVNVANCHPFYVNGVGALMHNGVFNIPQDVHKDMSDTWHYARRFEKHALDCGNPAPFFRAVHAFKQMERVTGTWNKVVILTDNGEFLIENEHAGDWRGGLWYSNTSSFPVTRTSSYSSTGWSEDLAEDWYNRQLGSGSGSSASTAGSSRIYSLDRVKVDDWRKLNEPLDDKARDILYKIDEGYHLTVKDLKKIPFEHLIGVVQTYPRTVSRVLRYHASRVADAIKEEARRQEREKKQEGGAESTAAAEGEAGDTELFGTCAVCKQDDGQVVTDPHALGIPDVLEQWPVCAACIAAFNQSHCDWCRMLIPEDYASVSLNSEGLCSHCYEWAEQSDI